MIFLFSVQNPTLILSDFLVRPSDTLIFNCGKQVHSSSSPLSRVTPILPPFTHGPLLRTPCSCSELEGRLLLFSVPGASSWDGLAALFITHINLLISTPPPYCKTSPLTSLTNNQLDFITDFCQSRWSLGTIYWKVSTFLALWTLESFSLTCDWSVDVEESTHVQICHFFDPFPTAGILLPGNPLTSWRHIKWSSKHKSEGSYILSFNTNNLLDFRLVQLF